jgi:hypothetical protein
VELQRDERLRDRRSCELAQAVVAHRHPQHPALALGGEGYTSFTIASPTGEGLTTVRNFTRERRCTLKEYFRIV